MIGDFHEAMCDAAGLEFDGPDVHGCDGCDDACGFEHPELPPVRLDPILWAPPLLAAKPEPSPEYRAYRAANRPFRRAFPGGEFRRRILHAVGVSTAASKEAQS